VADVQYLRPTPGGRSRRLNQAPASRGQLRRGHGPRYAGLGLGVLVLAVVVVGGLLMATAHAGLSTDSSALARVSLPFGGGSIQSAEAVTGPHSTPVPVQVRGEKIWPRKLIPAGERVSLDVVVKRPSLISWAAGSTETLHLTVATPVASLRSQFLTVRGSAPLRLQFRTPVAVFASGTPGQLHSRVLSAPSTVVTVARSGAAGTIFVAAAPRTWERARPASVSWFPAGGAATAVASPAPGASIGSSTPITLTFSKPVSAALGSHLPPVSPAAAGSWHQLSSHAIVFRPSGYGYGLGAKVHLALPSGVRLVGGRQSTNASGGTWTVPGGSTVRLQQVLSLLGYLPLKFQYSGSGVGLTPQEQLNAAVKPPAGHFSWQYANTPAALRGDWSPGGFGVMTRGALMAFENDHGITADGVAGPVVWRRLISAMLTGHRSTFGYTFVTVDKNAQRLTLWHNGNTVIGSTPVNTGISAAPTASGTYPVFEHIPVTTMSGTNPDGSHYSDPGIPWVSYFNGGDALHGFTRAQYGSPQSLGCVEMPFSVAGHVYPYTPIGTLVHVA
jgi:peptidoglycan hydrolase-like protein with peptidoglycan-binding domain